MTALTASSDPYRLRIAGLFLGLYALVGGAVSFIGWVFNLSRLTDWYNYGISIQPNTCIAVMAAGAALMLLNFGYWRVAAPLGVLVALIGGTVVFQFLTGINLGIDTLLMFDRTRGGAEALRVVSQHGAGVNRIWPSGRY